MPSRPVFAYAFTCRGVVLLGALNKRLAFMSKNEKTKTYLQLYCNKRNEWAEAAVCQCVTGISDQKQQSVVVSGPSEWDNELQSKSSLGSRVMTLEAYLTPKHDIMPYNTTRTDFTTAKSNLRTYLTGQRSALPHNAANCWVRFNFFCQTAPHLKWMKVLGFCFFLTSCSCLSEHDCIIDNMHEAYLQNEKKKNEMSAKLCAKSSAAISGNSDLSAYTRHKRCVLYFSGMYLLEHSGISVFK